MISWVSGSCVYVGGGLLAIALVNVFRRYGNAGSNVVSSIFNDGGPTDGSISISQPGFVVVVVVVVVGGQVWAQTDVGRLDLGIVSHTK